MSDESRDVSLDQLLDLVREIMADGIRGFEMGQVTDYDPDTQVATVQPVVMRATLNEAGGRVAKPSPQVARVVVWCSGSKAGRVTVPVRTGDYGLLLYSSVSLARWKQRGGVVDPLLDHKHGESDAVFIPGGHDLAHVPTDAPVDAVVLHAGPGVRVMLGGSDAAQAALKGTLYRTAEDTMLAAETTFLAALGVYGSALAALPGMSGPGATFATALAAFVTARTTFLAQIINSLSTIVTLK